MTRINFHGPKPVPAIEVLLYTGFEDINISGLCTDYFTKVGVLIWPN